MAWEQRYHQRYYTRSQRVGGRTKRIYVGKGVEGKLAEALDLQRRAERKAKADAERAMSAKIQAIGDLTRDLARHVATLAEAALLAAGFHQHDRGQWRRWRLRRQRVSGRQRPPEQADLGELVAIAKHRDQRAVPRLQQFLKTHPDIWQQAADMAAQAREKLLAMACGSDLAAPELVRRKMERSQIELMGDSTLPIVKLLAQTCVLIGIQVQIAEVALAAKNLKQEYGRDIQTKISTIHNRYLKALGSLATVQRLLVGDAGASVPEPLAAAPSASAVTAPTAMAG